VNAELKAKGHPTSGIGVIQANPDQVRTQNSGSLQSLDLAHLMHQGYSAYSIAVRYVQRLYGS
jgi:hypothetical protein